MLGALDNIAFAQFAIAVVIAAALAMWINSHAAKHGSKHATAWGIGTFLAALFVIPAYFLHYYVTRRRI